MLCNKENGGQGAPLIGVTAAFAFALSINKNPYITNIQKSYKALLETRPTAINLKWALNFIESRIKKSAKKKRGQIALHCYANKRRRYS